MGYDPVYNPANDALYGSRNRASVATFMNQVYAWMCVGLAITALVGYWTSMDMARMKAVFSGGTLFALFGAELLLVIIIAASINSIPPALSLMLFLVYAALNGFTLSVVFAVYTLGSITATFIVTAGTFASCSIYGFVTKRDLTSVGNLLLMALWGLILALIVNIFMASTALDWLITFAGVIIFVGLTAYDTQKLSEMAESCSTHELSGQAVAGALTLYLDFINLFLYLLKLFGKSKD